MLQGRALLVTKRWPSYQANKLIGKNNRCVILIGSQQQQRAMSYKKTVLNYQKRALSKLLRLKTSDAHNPNAVPVPTYEQLQKHFLHAAVPMIGFGFMDQTVLIQAGNAIDCTLGVAFGLSTMAAAAMGQIVSGAAAAVFGSSMNSVFRRITVSSGMTDAQRALTISRRANGYGALFGVVLGCILGCVNLLFIDTDEANIRKIEAQNEMIKQYYHIEASNDRGNATTFVIRGPDVDGLLASLTTALARHGCSLMEVQARQGVNTNETNNNENDENVSNNNVDDLLVVTKKGKPIPEHDLPEYVNILLQATTIPHNAHYLTSSD